MLHERARVDVSARGMKSRGWRKRKRKVFNLQVLVHVQKSCSSLFFSFVNGFHLPFCASRNNSHPPLARLRKPHLFHFVVIYILASLLSERRNFGERCEEEGETAYNVFWRWSDLSTFERKVSWEVFLLPAFAFIHFPIILSLEPEVNKRIDQRRRIAFYANALRFFFSLLLVVTKINIVLRVVRWSGESCINLPTYGIVDGGTLS